MDLSKLVRSAGSAEELQAEPSGKLLRAIVKLKGDGYRPSRLSVRASMGERIFTADISD